MAEVYHNVTYEDGDKYSGTWAEQKRKGHGVLSFADGSVFAGTFENGLCSGYGVLTFTDKSKYEGEFADGNCHGYGVLSKPDGLKYEGQFDAGKVSGSGRITLPDGSHGNPRQEGTFENHELKEKGQAGHAVQEALDAQEQAQRHAKAAHAAKK
eukprot:m.478458 g.478458  ORF g.478458 m.478458 type:complete len:154 (-) comp21146_c0_seq1:155-616(-)